MGTGPEMATPVGHTVRESGIEVVAIIRPPEPDPIAKINPSKTARYEAAHAVVARKRGKGVKGLSIIPGPGYKGVTWLEEFDPVAAMVHPGDGDGHDRLITILSGHNPDSAASAANTYKRENAKAITRVAQTAEVKGTLNRHDIDNAIAETEKPVEQKADIFVKNEDGSKQKIENVPVTNGIVIFETIKLTPGARREIIEKDKANAAEDEIVNESMADIDTEYEQLIRAEKEKTERELLSVRGALATLSSSASGGSRSIKL